MDALLVVLPMMLVIQISLGYPFEKLKHTNPDLDAPKPCCFPRQYEALMGTYIGAVSGSTPHLTQVSGKISMDFTNERVHATETVNKDGKKIVVEVIQDYKVKKITYVITGGKSCYKVPIKTPLYDCIPDGATYVGNFYYGVGDKTLDTSTWSINIPAIQQTSMLSVGPQCIPLGQVTFGMIGGNPGLLTSGFVNTTLGIKDPSVFVVPKICDVAGETVNSEFLHNMLSHNLKQFVQTHDHHTGGKFAEKELNVL